MKRTPSTWLLLAWILPAAGASLTALAQVQAETKPAEAAVEKNEKAVTSTHASSPETLARIGATLPKFSPPKEAQPEAELPDLRETDKPRNGIIRLPQHIVRETKMPEMKDRDLLTPDAKLDLAYKRHPGLQIGSPFLNNDKPARFMLAEEERLERIAEANDLTGLMESPAKAKALWKDSLPLLMRSNEWVEARFVSWAEFHQR
jgi:hypothetical protein